MTGDDPEGHAPFTGCTVHVVPRMTAPVGQTGRHVPLLAVVPAAQMGLYVPAQLAVVDIAAENGPHDAALMGTSTPSDISTTDACTSKHPVLGAGFAVGPGSRVTALPQRKVKVC